MKALFRRCCSRSARATILFSLSFLLGITAVSTVLAQRPLSVEEEHRLTRLETRLDHIAEELEQIRLHAWLELAGLGGLVAEAGVRISGKKKAG